MKSHSPSFHWGSVLWTEAGSVVAGDGHSMTLQGLVVEECSWAQGSSGTRWPRPGAGNVRLKFMVPKSS